MTTKQSDEIRVLKQKVESLEATLVQILDSVEFLMEAEGHRIDREREDIAEDRKDVERRLKAHDEDNESQPYVPNPKFRDPSVG